MKPPALVLQALTKRFGQVTAVDELDLVMEAGEFVTVLGPSGSGKTTTLAMIAGFEQPTSGEITTAGRRVTYEPPYKRDIGLVFQNYALFPHMSVYENLAFPLKMRSAGRDAIRDRVARALESVRLTGYERRYPRELSGGQQQRVALARATIYDPPLLLMDEPLSALDKKLRDEMRVEIRRFHRDLGASILYVTHDQDEALALSDRIVLMNDGRIVQVGTPEDMYERPQSLFTASFMGESNFLRGTVAAVTGNEVTVLLGSGHHVYARATTRLAEGQRVVVAVRPEHLEIGDANGGLACIGVQVEDSAYLGEYIRCQGAFEGGEGCILKVEPSRRDSAQPLLTSGRGRVSWRPDRAVALPANES